MKKVLITIISFFLLPIVSLAVDYDIDHYYISANVLENGDMEVAELIVLDGEFNGYERDILYRNSYTDTLLNATDISDVEIYAKYVSDVSFDTFNEEFDEFTKVSSAYNGAKAMYTASDLYDGYRFRMYYPADNESVAFLIKYTLQDVVIMHDDFAEVYWTFIGNDFADPINDLQIKLLLPGIDNSDYFRIWAHGEVNGEVNFANTSSNSGLLATSNKVSAYTPTDVRCTFDKSLVSSDIDKYSTETFTDIIERETVLADEQNEKRLSEKHKYYGSLAFTIILYIYIIISWIYVYIKYDKERKTTFNMQYNREFIDDYNVEVVDYLMNRNITENALSASVMNLIYKKNIKAEKLSDVKDGYLFTLENRDNLNDTENMLVDFLFNKVGNGSQFSTKDLKKYASSTKTCNSFMNSYTAWKNQVIKDGKEQGFFETKKPYLWFSLIALIASILLFMYLSVNNIVMFIGYLALFISIIYLIYTIAFSKRTEKGGDHYAKWKAFKNFLNDFGNFSVKELPEIILWERYLVYATVFGLADKVEKAMNVKIKEISPADMANGTYMYHDHLFDIYLANSINRAMHSAITSSQSAITRDSVSSSMSSGGGFGGGFSSGGGFGGGGGGGRGF